ncbi:MAG: DUF1667 domain-containing protein [Clostridia bacterium]|nr:DUF1667 domain-containing protein [Clostridia bacterium]
MKKVNLTCIECPIGCDITVEIDGEKVLSVQGNACQRGKLYVSNEVVCPVRVLTTTVKTQNGKMLPVKSNKPIKKADIFVAMEKINGVVAKTPIKIGERVIADIFDGVDIIACADVE